MDKQTAQLARADEAQRILNSPVFELAFDQIHAAYVKQWEESPTAETEDAKDIHRRLKCLADVKQALQAHISTGKVVEKQQSMLEKAGGAVRSATKTLSNLNRSR